MYPQGWIGDGLVAEIFGKSEETRNFLENVSELQYHVSWVNWYHMYFINYDVYLL